MPTQRDMSGILFKNDRKTQTNQPDYTGDCKVNGTVYRLAAWVKQGAQGKFLSLAISVPQAQQPKPEPPHDPNAEYKADDEIPFD